MEGSHVSVHGPRGKPDASEADSGADSVVLLERLVQCNSKDSKVFGVVC